MERRNALHAASYRWGAVWPMVGLDFTTQRILESDNLTESGAKRKLAQPDGYLRGLRFA